MATWINKFVASFLASIAILNSLFLFTGLMPLSVIQKYPMLLYYLVIFQIVGGTIFAIVYSIIWKGKEDNIDSINRFGFLLGIIRCWLAFTLSIYGFAKILGTQFGPSYIREDSLFGHLAGFDLTWGYFGYSYGFSVIIALVQIAGAVLLLSRQTILLGVLILLPVMINIVLVNVFYSIAFGAFLNSVFISASLVYILFWYKQVIRELFKKARGIMPVFKTGKWKFFIPFVVLGLALIYVDYLKLRLPATGLQGKWSVMLMVRNKDTIPGDAWIIDNRAWKSVYIEPHGFISFCANPYCYDEQRSIGGFYKYDQNQQKLNITFPGQPLTDSSNIIVTTTGRNKMQWQTIFNNDTLVLDLLRVSRK